MCLLKYLSSASDCGNHLMLSAHSYAHGNSLEDSRTRHFTRAAVQRMGPLVLCPELSCKVGTYLFSSQFLWRAETYGHKCSFVVFVCVFADFFEIRQTYHKFMYRQAGEL